jgi:serine protease Do
MRKLLLILALTAFAVADKPQAKYERVTPIVEAYRAAEDSIVNISGKQLVSERPRNLMEYYNLFGPQRKQNYKLRRFELGSGFVVHEDGYIITNAHVVKGADKLSVTFINGKEYEADIISADETKDLAFLKIEAQEKFKAIKMGTSCDLMIGESVVAVGNPFGYSNSVTEGIISAVGRNIHVRDDFWLRGLLQTSAPINPGNSGGPLLNINGELIGINTAIRQEAQNIGFAIPVDALTNNLIDMLMPEKLRRVRLGVVIGKMSCSPDDEHHGLTVTAVAPESPAMNEGVEVGDLITSIDGSSVTNFIDFYVKIMDKEVDQTIELECYRESDDQKHSFTLKLEHRPIPDGSQIFERFFQMEISELDAATAKKFDFDSPYPVLIITDVSQDGVGGTAGLKAGDIVLTVNSTPVDNMQDFSLEMEKINEGDSIEIEILRIGWWGSSQVQRHYRVKLTAQQYKDIKGKVIL